LASCTAEAVFGIPIVLPNKFLQGDGFSVNEIVKKTLNASAFSLPRHNSSTQLQAELPDELLRAPFVWLCCGVVVPPLHRPYDGPYAIVEAPQFHSNTQYFSLVQWVNRLLPV
jgi:hypothetical protein